MKLLTYKTKEGIEELGVLSASGEAVISAKDAGVPFSSMQELILKGGEAHMALLQKASSEMEGVPFSSVEKMAPIPRPAQDVICLGINYMDHAVESARFKKEDFNGERPNAVYFSKRVSLAVADGEPINGHFDIVDDLDYESELAVIIGKTACNVPAEEAEQYIFGYTVLNDVSARTIQNRHKQWYYGKGMDGFTPMGPWIVTKDEIAWPPKLDIWSKVNGEIRQKSNTSLLIFDIAFVISELSKGMTLLPGTIISMGTPAGVGMGFVPPKFLKKGDIVECGVENIGVLVNPVG